MYKHIGILVGVLLLVSCNSKSIYNQYETIENNQWSSTDAIKFIINNQDTISKKNVFINIRNTKDYAFSSLFLIAKIEFPSGFQIVDTLEYEMADAKGKWLGTGFTDIKENKLFYKENIVFFEKGEYTIEVQHATRSIHDIEGINPLAGIYNVGLSIEKVIK